MTIILFDGSGVVVTREEVRGRGVKIPILEVSRVEVRSRRGSDRSWATALLILGPIVSIFGDAGDDRPVIWALGMVMFLAGVILVLVPRAEVVVVGTDGASRSLGHWSTGVARRLEGAIHDAIAAVPRPPEGPEAAPTATPWRG